MLGCYPVPPPEAGSAHGTRTVPAVPPQARKPRGTPPVHLMLRGRGGTSVPSGAERPPFPGAAGGVGPLHLLQVLYKALAAVELPVPDPCTEACATS